MSINTSRPILAALAAVALCATPFAANATVIVHGAWDPVFSGTFTTMSFSGSADFLVDNSCLVPQTTQNVPADCGPASLQDATLVLTDVPDMQSQTISFAGGDFVTSLFTESDPETGDPEVTGIATSLIGPGSPFASLPNYNGPVWLQFSFTLLPVVTLSDQLSLLDSVTLQHATTSVMVGICNSGITQNDDSEESDNETCSTPDVNSDPATVTLTTSAVPEPATLGLIGGALVAGWLARRRRKA